jgi:cytochrome P450
VIKESIRLHSVVQIVLQRTVPAGGINIHRHFLPESTTAGCHPQVIHLNKKFFGDGADEVNPDRWLDSEGKLVKEMNRTWLVFGAGKRVCIGRHLWVERNS